MTSLDSLRPVPGRGAILLATGGLTALAAAVAFGVDDRRAGAVAVNGVIVVLGLAGGALGVLRARREPRARVSWLLLGFVAAVGVVSSALAIADTWSKASADTMIPYPTAADLLNVPFLALLGVAHLLWPVVARSPRARLRTALDGLIFGTATFFLSWAVVLGDLVATSPQPAIAKAAAVLSWMATTFGLGVLAYVCIGHPRVTRGPIGWFALAAICAAAANLLLALIALRGRYYIGHPADFFGVLGYAAGLAAMTSPRPAVPAEDASETTSALSPPWTDTLPYWPVLLSIPVSLLALRGREVNDTFQALAVALVLLLILRQFIALRDLRALSGHLETIVLTRTSELERSMEALARTQRLESVGKLAGGIAHDFNNILMVLGGCAEGLRARLGDGRDFPELALIEGAVTRATRLTRQLLTFSKHRAIAPKVLEPRQLVRDLEGLLRQAVDDGVTLALDVDACAAHVEIDPGQLEQVLLNLAVNARDAMPDGGRLAITLAEDPAGAVLLTVADTGQGMSPEVRARAFEPFFTTKGSEGGTGLGLATVYGIVTQAGGEVTLSSRPGEGTVVLIRLPCVATPPSAGVPPKPPDTGSESERKRVLLADDDGSVRGLLSHALAHAGYDVLVAADGQEAVELAAAHAGRIDVLVSDAVMPRLGGQAAAAHIRKSRRDLPVVLISGHGIDASPDAPALPHAYVLPKPFSTSELLALVRRAIDESVRP